MSYREDYIECFCYIRLPRDKEGSSVLKIPFVIKSLFNFIDVDEIKLINDEYIIITFHQRWSYKYADKEVRYYHENINEKLLKFYEIDEFTNDLLYFDTRSYLDKSYYVGIINNKYEQILDYHIHPDMNFIEFFEVVPRLVIQEFKLVELLFGFPLKSSNVSSAQEKNQPSTDSSTPPRNTSDKLRYQEVRRREQEQKKQAAIRKKQEEEQKKAKMYQDIAREKQADVIARFSKIKSVDKKQIIDYAESLLRKFDIKS